MTQPEAAHIAPALRRVLDGTGDPPDRLLAERALDVLDLLAAPDIVGRIPSGRCPLCWRPPDCAEHDRETARLRTIIRDLQTRLTQAKEAA